MVSRLPSVGRQATRVGALWAAGLVLVGCAVVLGEYEVEEDTNGGGASSTTRQPPECTTHDECEPPTNRCDDGYCRQPCLQQEECYYYFTVCEDGFCSEHIGTLCNIDDDCGGLDCVALDNRDGPMAGYCSNYCSHMLDCPAEYECIQHECRAVGPAGPLCYVWKDAPCSTCVVQECYWELGDCCGYASPCATVQAQIDECDQTRSWDDCQPLHNENTVDEPSYELLDCITSNCESACWNPCPGAAC